MMLARFNICVIIKTMKKFFQMVRNSFLSKDRITDPSLGITMMIAAFALAKLLS